jgi:hypothetical protein
MIISNPNKRRKTHKQRKRSRSITTRETGEGRAIVHEGGNVKGNGEKKVSDIRDYKRRKKPSPKKMGFGFPRSELLDLLAAWGILSAAFAIHLRGYAAAMGWVGLVFSSILVTALAFGLHELAHRFVARRYGASARFQANYPLLGISFVSAFLPFMFLAPGAVVTSSLNREGACLDKGGWTDNEPGPCCHVPAEDGSCFPAAGCPIAFGEFGHDVPGVPVLHIVHH